jgi:hypothetical protein
MAQMAKGLCSLPPLDATMVTEELGRLKWFLWHGNVFRALQTAEDLEVDLDVEDPGPEQRKLQRAVAEFSGYIRANAGCIPNYGERYRAGEAISSAFAESAVNQVVSKRMVKKQQMRWTPRGGASPTRGPHPGAQRRTRRRLPWVVGRQKCRPVAQTALANRSSLT